MRSTYVVIVIVLFLFLGLALASAPDAAQRQTVHRRQSGSHHVHHRYPKRHRSKMQHAKIIGGTAKTGASIGGMVAGPPGMAAGAAAGAAAGTAYDLKTRKVKPKQ